VDKIAVLIVGELPPKPGGIASVVSTILDSDYLNEKFSFHGYDITSKQRFANTEKTGIRISGIFRRIRKAIKLLQLVNYYKPEIIHYHVVSDLSFYSDALNLFLLKFTKCKVVFHFHNDPISEISVFPPKHSKGIKNIIFRWVIIKVDAFVVLGDKYAQFIESQYPSKKTHVLNNCIRERNCSGTQDERTGDLIVLYMARLSELKGIFDLLLLAQMCQENELNIQFIVAGNYNTSAEQAAVQSFLINLNLENIEFVGVVFGDKKAGILSRVDVLLFPSQYEGFPITILELAQNKKPSIAYNIGMLNEIIIHNHTGYIVPYLDRNELYKHLLKYYNNRELISEHGNNAFNHISSRFSRYLFEKRLESIYRNVMQY
jgi:glycosyltransferase involved in cell wall biosynthesis